jgi:hypothetical protein
MCCGRCSESIAKRLQFRLLRGDGLKRSSLIVRLGYKVSDVKDRQRQVQGNRILCDLQEMM